MTTDRGAPSGGRQSQRPSRPTRPIQVCPAAAFPRPVICPKNEIYLTAKTMAETFRGDSPKESKTKQKRWKEKQKR